MSSGTDRKDHISDEDSTSTESSLTYEKLDPNDAHLGHLASEMFKDIREFIVEETELVSNEYNLLEKMNKLTTLKYSGMNKMLKSLNRNMEAMRESQNDLADVLKEIDELVPKVNKLESVAFRLMNFVDALIARLEAVGIKDKI